MEGAKWAAGRLGGQKVPAELTERDVFNLACSTTRRGWSAPEPGLPNDGHGWRGDPLPGGAPGQRGTELGVALEQALGQKRQSGEAARHVLIITAPR